MNPPLSMMNFVPVGRFFSMGDGRVGQYLSTRVLSVRTPFRRYSRSNDVCYLGFDKLSQAQKFAQSLASSGLRFTVQKSQVLTQFPYEIKLYGDTETAKRLAYWDRKDHDRSAKSPAQRSVIAA
ncbi:hypothetical protein ACQ4M3_04745 [Leptolyngbya sp. AN03gr2]|uniref:hypothetical protein n=1 Tax=unclassified Leptolyngbya TaxID=2650499 RepID=UPI003D313B8F